MLEKAHNTSRLIFSTGTPLTNSLTDLYTLQLYLQPELLAYHNLHTFDTWINTFGQREVIVECDVDSNSNSFRVMTRFTSFHNLGELMGMFSQVCDFHHIGENAEGLPYFAGHTEICVPKNAVQEAYIQELSERTEKIRNREVKRHEDNLLKVTTDGRKAALDVRLVMNNLALASCGFGKTAACAKKVFELYQKTDGVQIVFSDIGVPKDCFNVYDDLKDKLIGNFLANTLS